MVKKIETVREYFDHVVIPDYRDLCADKTDLRKTFHCCTSLLSLRDWVEMTHRNKNWFHNKVPQKPFFGKTNIQDMLASLCSSINVVADVANASKHMILDRGYTPLYGSANVVIQATQVSSSGAGLGATPIGAAPLGAGIESVVVEIGGSYYDVFGCVTDSYNVWSSLINENRW
jgi:hypothetical protein